MKQVVNYQTNKINIEHSYKFFNFVNDLCTSDFVLRSRHVYTNSHRKSTEYLQSGPIVLSFSCKNIKTDTVLRVIFTRYKHIKYTLVWISCFSKCYK